MAAWRQGYVLNCQLFNHQHQMEVSITICLPTKSGLGNYRIPPECPPQPRNISSHC
jgi:hypothetical protein